MRADQISAGLVGGVPGAPYVRMLQDAGAFSDPPMPALDRFAALATKLVGAAVALVSVTSGSGQHILARVGRSAEAAQTPQVPTSDAYCRYVVEQQAPLIVSDARRDSRLTGDFAVVEPAAIAVAGFPLVTPDGRAFGSFCVVDDRPRGWSETELSILNDLAVAVESQFVLRSAHAELRRSASRVGDPHDDDPDGHRLGAVVAVHDITETRHAEILRRAQYAVAQALAEATSAEQAAAGTVTAVATALGWIGGEYWQVDDDRLTITRQSCYRAPEQDGTAFTDSAPAFTTRGDGLPGLVWDRDAEVWASAGSPGELPADAGPAVWRAGVRTAIGVPVRTAGDVQGVLVFYAGTDLIRDELIAAMLDAVCAHLGRFVERRRAEDLMLALATARRDFDRIIERVHDYVWTVEISAEGAVRSIYASPDGTGVFGGRLPTDADMVGVLAARMDPADLAAFAAFHATLRAGEPAEIECRILGYDGRTRWVWTRAVTRQEGGRLFADGICTNVTDRHHLAEQQHAVVQAVRDSEQLLTAVAAVARRTRTGLDARSTIISALLQLAEADQVVLMEVAKPAEETLFASQTFSPTDLIVTAAAGAAVVGTRIPLSLTSMTTTVYRSGQTVFLADVASDPRVSPSLLALSDARSVLWQPVISGGRVVAVLNLSWNQRLEALTDHRARAIDLLADETAMVLTHEELLHRLEQMALTDSLTGLANRRAWHSDLPRLFSQARRNGRPLTLAIADLDHFKRYNDSYGHPAGDELLRRTATAFTDVLRDSDLLVRWGGEEFAIVLVDCSTADAAVVLSRVRIAVPDRETCSIGYATWDGDETAEDLLGRADAALYQAKNAGRDIIRVSSRGDG